MTEYEQDTGLNEAVKTLMSDRKLAEFKPLNDQSIVVRSFLKVTTNTAGEHTPCKGCPVKVQKVSDLHRAAGIDAHFILIMDYYAWNHPKGIDPVLTQEALLHFALKTIKIEVKDGKVKKGKNEPEIVQFVDTAKRYPDVMTDFEEVLAPSIGYSKRLAIAAASEVDAEAGSEGVGQESETTEEEPPQVRRGGRK